MNTKCKILIAEDEEINFFLLKLWIQDSYCIIHAKNGEEAIKLLNENPNINLVIMDIRMPYMNGIEATKTIRETNATIPIIAHTAYAMNDEHTSIMEAGFNDILIKPSNKDSIIQMLKKYLID
ncbi:response regulator [Maribacter sp. X9]|uniref:response regulator n=1 Tax=Maribacter sp. X9 TaxID=3402159 RepID=UPI003AF3ED15